jgi:hypothetical protein
MKLEFKGKRFNDVLQTQLNSQPVFNDKKRVSDIFLKMTELLGSTMKGT